MRARVMTPREAVDLIKDGDTVVIGGSGGGVTEATALLRVIGERYEAASRPRDLTLVHSTCLNFFAHEGIVRREIGGHYVMSPKFTKMVLENKLEAHNFPQGVFTQLYREIAGGRPGVITQVGLETYVDPRLGGGKLNPKTTEDLVEVINLAGKEWLLYRSMKLDAVLLRGTTADEKGNISMEHEPAVLDGPAMAQALHNCGGKSSSR